MPKNRIAAALAASATLVLMTLPAGSAHGATTRSGVLTSEGAAAARSFGVPDAVIQDGLTDPSVAQLIPVSSTVRTTSSSSTPKVRTSSNLVTPNSAADGTCASGRLYSKQIANQVNNNFGLRLYTVYYEERWCGSTSAKTIYSDWSKQHVEFAPILTVGLSDAGTSLMDNSYIPVVSGYARSGHYTIRYQAIRSCDPARPLCWTDTLAQASTIYYSGVDFSNSWWV